MPTTEATNRSHDATRVTRARVSARAHLCALLVAAFQVATGAQADRPRAFATPEEAVRALVDAAKQGNLDLMLAIFGPDGRELAATSDPATARMNLKVFSVAAKERMRLDDAGPNRKTLVIGNEDWPFPVRLRARGLAGSVRSHGSHDVHGQSGWHRFREGSGQRNQRRR
jgi:DUF2950 family protein